MRGKHSHLALGVGILVCGLVLALSLRGSISQAVYTPKELSDALSKFKATNARFAKGCRLFYGGDLAAAAREFEACLSTLPAHVYAHYYLANIRYIQQDYTRALEAIENAERNLNFMAAVEDYSRNLESKDMDEAKRLLREETEASVSCRERRELEWMSADVKIEEENAASRAEHEARLRKSQASHYAYFHGNILFQLRKFDEAFRQYNAAIQADPQNGDACNNAAAILFLAGRPQEADQYLQRAVAAGVEDRINLKLKKVIAERLGLPTAGILEEEFGAEGNDFRLKRFSINPYEGQPGRPPLFANSYIIYDTRSRDAVIIDPGAADPRLEAFIRENHLAPRLVLNTHGHPDHTRGNAHYARLYGIKIAASGKDTADYTPDNGSLVNKADLLLLSPSQQAGTILIRVFATPGHTPGGVCFLMGNYLFSGDSLFEDTVGRVNLDNAAEKAKARKTMVALLKDMLAPLPAEVQLLPGHGKATTAGHVREVNPFLK